VLSDNGDKAYRGIYHIGSNNFDGNAVDSIINAAALALAKGDPLVALNRVALREDAPALALRGVAMAQLGEFGRATALLRKAARAFGSKYASARARCVVAEAEIALVSRDLRWPTLTLAKAQGTLKSHGDYVNAAYAQHLQIRRLLLMGKLDDAESALTNFSAAALPPAFTAAHELLLAGLATRRLRIKDAADSLARAQSAALQARNPALQSEVESALLRLRQPAARLITMRGETFLNLEQVELLNASGDVIIDACRYAVRHDNTVISFASRPILFSLAKALGESWPGDISRDLLIARAFNINDVDESLRVRLRVEIGRLRTALQNLAEIGATERGFVLTPLRAANITVLAQAVDEQHSAILALLADGEAWSSSALAMVLECSQRKVQRALDALARDNKVQAFGRGRARRWLSTPVPGFTTTLLLPGSLPSE